MDFMNFLFKLGFQNLSRITHFEIAQRKQCPWFQQKFFVLLLPRSIPDLQSLTFGEHSWLLQTHEIVIGFSICSVPFTSVSANLRH